MKYERGSFIVVPSREKLRGMPVPAQSLYMWLCAYANETGECFPSRARLAKDLDCSLPTIDRFTQLLVDRGLLTVEKRINEKREYTTNLYSLVVWEGGSHTDLPPSHTGLPRVATQIDKELNPVLTESTEVPAFAEFSIQEENTDTDLPEKTECISGKEKIAYESMCKWAEAQRGSKFVHRLKQYKALKDAKLAGIKSTALKERWEEMSIDKFFSKNGFDWTNVVASFNRKGV